MSQPEDGVQPRHVSVLPAEVVSLLDPRPGQIFVDATVGAGGHALLLARAVAPLGRVIGLDRDDAMLALAAPRLVGLPVTLVQSSFEDLREILAEQGMDRV